MILHFLSTGTWSNRPIKENGLHSLVFEISLEDMQLVEEGEKELYEENNIVKLRKSTRKKDLEKARADLEKQEESKKTRKKELISKIVEGTATDQEQQEFLNIS